MVDRPQPTERLGHRVRETMIPERFTGHASRAKNKPSQDSYVLILRRGRVGVFDGVGGEPRGMNAAETASLSIVSQTEHQKPAETEQAVIDNMTRLLQTANNDVRKTGGKTTATVAQLFAVDGQQKVLFGNVGDSQGYVWRKPRFFMRGKLQPITISDDLIHQALSPRNAARLSQELDNSHRLRHPNRTYKFEHEIPDFPIYVNDVETHQRRTRATQQEFFNVRAKITAALGSHRILPRLSITDVKPGDIILLTTDGIHDNLTTSDIKRIVSRNRKKPQAAAEALVAAAERKSKEEVTIINIRPKNDDMTAVAIRVS
ncbi:MAG TPA: protein phosphatase 2C domain-containing protein [Patescibacteria group bacterium]|nr:protein phosphatase 2C domain-containing protein [Patescibacteria group bacterium]